MKKRGVLVPLAFFGAALVVAGIELLMGSPILPQATTLGAGFCITGGLFVLWFVFDVCAQREVEDLGREIARNRALLHQLG